ncbi:MAG: dTMP kinase [Bacillota bacterium]|nr:dTMP kinase [Bacillota bacterium]
MKGYFLALEGPDGSGKSTIAKLLKEKLEEDYKRPTVLTREPGGTKIGEEIRSILLSTDNMEMANRTEALLYAASRAQHVEEKILPLVKENNIVISDRYLVSSLAYQGFSRGLGLKEVMDINLFAINGFYPDRIIFFDLDSNLGLKRKFAQKEGDRLEIAGEDFHKQVYLGYKEAIKKYPAKVKIIDASASIDQVLKSCLEIIKEDLNL